MKNKWSDKPGRELVESQRPKGFLACLGVRRKTTRALLMEVLAKLEAIMATQAELTQQLTDTKAKVEKIGNETRTLLTKIQELQDALANQPNVTPELKAAADALDAQVSVVDDLVPDAPPPA